MKREESRLYFERRAREERRMAEQASDPISYKLHLELARQYEMRLLDELRLTA